MPSICEVWYAPDREPIRDTRLTKALTYIASHHSEPALTRLEVAKVVGISARQLGRIMKTSLGLTFQQYLTNLRMDLARQLLRATEPQVKQIAGDVGFSDPSNFCRCFRRCIGLSPGEFRREARSRMEGH